jgi:hypothetical protein
MLSFIADIQHYWVYQMLLLYPIIKEKTVSRAVTPENVVLFSVSRDVQILYYSFTICSFTKYLFLSASVPPSLPLAAGF